MTRHVKTAISVPGDVFERAEREAERAAISRSELYVRALREYLERRASTSITEQLDEYFAAHPDVVEPWVQRAALATLRRNEW